MTAGGAPTGNDLDHCAALIAAGGVAAIPTDTLYGLGASITIAAAVARVLAIKGRPSGEGLPVLLAAVEQAAQVGQIVSHFDELAAAFWPGGLTLVIPALPSVDRGIVDARGTVAVRLPGMDITRELARLSGAPLTSTSANRSGTTPPVTAAEAHSAVGATVDYVLDAGHVSGTASTIVDLSTPRPQVLRAGAVALADLCRIVPALAGPDESQGPRA